MPETAVQTMETLSEDADERGQIACLNQYALKPRASRYLDNQIVGATSCFTAPVEM